MSRDGITENLHATVPSALQPHGLIIGCGYLGAVAARRLADAGRAVWATTRTQGRWDQLAACCTRLTRFDITAAGNAGALPPSDTVGPFDVFVMLTPSAIVPAIATGAYNRLIAAIAALNPRRAVLVSSTGVYGEQAGGSVTAETPPRPNSIRGKQLLEIETQWLGAGRQYRVCRLAGIYGPGRVIGREALRRGEALPGDPQAWLNLIHVDDAADLAIRCASTENAHAVELGSDNCAVSRDTYYSYLASLLGAGAPRFDPGRSARSGSKRCDPGSTLRRLDWHPQYQDYRAGLAASLVDEGAGA